MLRMLLSIYLRYLQVLIAWNCVHIKNHYLLRFWARINLPTGPFCECMRATFPPPFFRKFVSISIFSTHFFNEKISWIDTWWFATKCVTSDMLLPFWQQSVSIFILWFLSALFNLPWQYFRIQFDLIYSVKSWEWVWSWKWFVPSERILC